MGTAATLWLALIPTFRQQRPSFKAVLARIRTGTIFQNPRDNPLHTRYESTVWIVRNLLDAV